MMKILMLVPDGVGVRNYLYSELTKELINRNAEICLYHKISKNAINEIRKINDEIEFYEIPDFTEKAIPRFLRESSAYGRLKYFSRKLKNPSILKFWIIKPKTFKQKALYGSAVFFGRFFSKWYSVLRFLENKYEAEIKKSGSYQKAKNELQQINPDIVINLHQRASITAPIMSAAKELNMKTATFIFSWDNIPKGRLISRPDSYLVWSDLMKKDLCFLYPEINEASVFVVGSPQFEFYFKSEYKLSKDDFFNKYGLNTSKKTICFSGDDISSSPFDQVYLRDLCEQILTLKEEERPQILFRRCPVDFSDRFDQVLDDHKELIVEIKPDWRVEKETDKQSFSLIYPSLNDVYLLVNTCLHSDLVINLGSTMAHDFAVFNKPCLYLNYNPVRNSDWKVEDIYEFQHFKSMDGLNAVGWVNSKEEFIDKVFKCINNPDEIAVERNLWLEKIIKHPLEGNSKEIANLIANLCTSAS
ncbi:hypothetical protein NAT51_06180 [Flavobacterium amniphilum]|uniref:hypothetical protein n=1 Tax=Flavobacterium amniphilum TaxID=1834035 RepID=UPI00202A41AC|nr:hypothetical protein [Flavobacterium amniphilum]MCL9805097.1 hypothetical protein [Flavobacterium amniphilum]